MRHGLLYWATTFSESDFGSRVQKHYQVWIDARAFGRHSTACAHRLSDLQRQTKKMCVFRSRFADSSDRLFQVMRQNRYVRTAPTKI